MRSESTAQADVDSQFQALFATAGAKERASIDKHLAVCDAEGGPSHGQLWRRIASKLRALAPQGLQTVGQHAVMFFIPDGKYRMQVFALEDQRDGRLMIYLPDVLADAQRKKVLLKSKEPGFFGIPQASGSKLQLEALDAANTPAPQPHFKNMLGWNRKALRITLNTAESDPAQAAAVEALCDLAAKKWATDAVK